MVAFPKKPMEIMVVVDVSRLRKALDELREEHITETGDITDIIDIGPQCFASGDLSVICFQGENYYRACGELVTGESEDEFTTCVKRVNHPDIIHEDYDGSTRHTDG